MYPSTSLIFLYIMGREPSYFSTVNSSITYNSRAVTNLILYLENTYFPCRLWNSYHLIYVPYLKYEKGRYSARDLGHRLIVHLYWIICIDQRGLTIRSADGTDTATPGSGSVQLYQTIILSFHQPFLYPLAIILYPANLPLHKSLASLASLAWQVHLDSSSVYSTWHIQFHRCLLEHINLCNCIKLKN